ncbi:hypothetical protein [Shewanella saliphila]|uniref:Uncharacterized protein n=1 Tax=Shewanella saliphila TaxID=2282698 RepID=A0ABQ2Q5J8_9GAMM|nr:hypothetical protein [Shewanella saliphila]MCL1101903.1 hypothetical protein [Shewanella saliphila]GGP51974.1 hypothetical protein GCM10009409_17950 [Shewanella saliphila]
MSIDSIYAMLARPVRAVSEHRRIVEQVNRTSAISADSHEAPQSQLPPHITHKPVIHKKTLVRKERRSKLRTIDDKKNTGSRLRRMATDERFSTRGETASQHIDIEV